MEGSHLGGITRGLGGETEKERLNVVQSIVMKDGQFWGHF